VFGVTSHLECATTMREIEYQCHWQMVRR